MNYRLKNFTDAQLVEELVCRRNQLQHEHAKINAWCENCKNFVGWIQSGKAGDMPNDYNPCIKRHKMGFQTPLEDHDPYSTDYGFYRIVCADRVEGV